MSTENIITRDQRASAASADARPAPSRKSSPWTYRPDADILYGEDAYAIVLDMPGVAPDDVEVTVENSTLLVHGHVTRAAVPQNATIIRNEYGVGDYLRRFEFNDTIDREQITAECAGGVLTVHLPKVAAARPRRIKIAVRDGDDAE